MECNQDILDRYHDGELPAEEAARVESHRASCAACDAYLAGLSALSGRLRSAERESPAPEVVWAWKGLPKTRSERHVRRLAGWLTTAAAAALAISLLTRTETTQATPTTFGDIDAAVLARGDEPETPGVLTAQWMAADLRFADNSGGGNSGANR